MTISAPMRAEAALALLLAAAPAAAQTLPATALENFRHIDIGNGILTVETEAQALARAKASELDKGGGAARACLAVIGVRKRLLGTPR